MSRPPCEDPDSCGTNSTYLTGSSLDALALDGCPNVDGVRLVLHTVSPGGDSCRGARMDLAVKNGALIAVEPGSPVLAHPGCSGDAHVGATFWIEGPATRLPGITPVSRSALGQRGVREELQIRETGTFVTFAGRELPSYVLEPTGSILVEQADGTWAAPSAGTYGVSPLHLCSPLGRDTRGRPTGPGPMAMALTSTETAPDLPTQAVDDSPRVGKTPAIVADGEYYNGGGDVLATDPTWFHLACEGSALVDARWRDLTPAELTPAKRAAANKALMAFYCGATMTLNGTSLDWFLRGDTRATTRTMSLRAVEARWGVRGATCISHSRLWNVRPAYDHRPRVLPELYQSPDPAPRGDEAAEKAFVRWVQEICNIAACPETEPGDDDYWVTKVVGHIEHPVEIVPVR